MLKNKIKQRLRHTPRQSNRKYGTWDKISTRYKNKVTNNNIIINNTTLSDIKSQVDGTVGETINIPTLIYLQNKPQRKDNQDRGLINKTLHFFLGSIGIGNSIFNSKEIIPINPKTAEDSPDNYHSLLEYKIDFHDRYLQPACVDKSRKLLEIQNVIEDECDEGWSFVPKAILDHRKRITPI